MLKCHSSAYVVATPEHYITADFTPYYHSVAAEAAQGVGEGIGLDAEVGEVIALSADIIAAIHCHLKDSE